MRRVVPSEEGLAVRPRILDATEAIRKVRTVLQRLELRLGIRIVIADMRAAMGLGDIQVDQQGRHRLRSHAGAAIRVQGEGTGCDVLFGDGVGDQLLGQFSALARGDHPADHVAAEDIQNHVQMEARPLARPAQLSDVPRPNFIGLQRQQLRLGVDRVGGWPTGWPRARAIS